MKQIIAFILISVSCSFATLTVDKAVVFGGYLKVTNSVDSVFRVTNIIPKIKGHTGGEVLFTWVYGDRYFDVPCYPDSSERYRLSAKPAIISANGYINLSNFNIIHESVFYPESLVADVKFIGKYQPYGSMDSFSFQIRVISSSSRPGISITPISRPNPVRDKPYFYNIMGQKKENMILIGNKKLIYLKRK